MFKLLAKTFEKSNKTKQKISSQLPCIIKHYVMMQHSAFYSICTYCISGHYDFILFLDQYNWD